MKIFMLPELEQDRELVARMYAGRSLRNAAFCNFPYPNEKT
jgi:hypothetical protein